MRRRANSGAADLLAMQRAAQRTWTPESRWHVGDLAWRGHSIPNAESTALWRDEGERVWAWGWVESPNHLGLYVDPACPELTDEVLAWFDEVAAGSPRWVTVMETEENLVTALKRAGYRPVDKAPFFLHCVIDLDDAVLTPGLPEGYRVRAVRAGESEQRAAVHRSAWRPARIGRLWVPPRDLGDGESSMTAESYQTVMNTWPYRHDLDQVVEAPGGTLAAFALGWLDEVNRVGELEPVGTDPRHARRGLGAAVSMACLRAMKDAGATRAVVYPRGDNGYPVPRRLYDRLGFRPAARTITFTR